MSGLVGRIFIASDNRILRQADRQSNWRDFKMWL